MKNSHLFDQQNYGSTYLRARGFQADGSRAGGIVDPQRVTLHQQTVLIRLFTRYNGPAGYGEWWNTPHELNTVIDYLAIDGRALAQRAQPGKVNAMQGLLVLLPSWNNEADTFHVIRLKEDLEAFHGEADLAETQPKPGAAAAPAPAPQGTAKKGERVSPFLITDRAGRRRAARQLMIPDFRVSAAFEMLHVGAPLADLPGIARGFDSGPARFER